MGTFCLTFCASSLSVVFSSQFSKSVPRNFAAPETSVMSCRDCTEFEREFAVGQIGGGDFTLRGKLGIDLSWRGHAADVVGESARTSRHRQASKGLSCSLQRKLDIIGIFMRDAFLKHADASSRLHRSERSTGLK